MGLLSRITALFSSLSNTQYPWPALDIVLPGDCHLHLVGSIHMGTRDMAPLPGKLIDKLNNADALIVEADISEGGSPFPNNTDELPLEQRLSGGDWEQVVSLTQELGIPLSQIDNQPAWQIALVLQAYQAQRLGLRAEYGIDFQLLGKAKTLAIPIIELEGAQHQVEILTRLPEGGMPLLTDTLTHWHTNARLLQTMISWWMDSPPRTNVALPNTFGHDLYDVLMHQRNLQWQHFLQQLPAGRYVVAVGALHLYGEGNLPGLLKYPTK